jgi:hypothetical protein
MSADQFTTRLRVLAVKTQLNDPATLIPSIRRLIKEMAPTIPVAVRTALGASMGQASRIDPVTALRHE